MLKTFVVAAIAAALTTTCALAQDKPTIALIQIDLTNPFHLGEVDGAKEAARREGFNLVVTSRGRRDQADPGDGKHDQPEG